MYLVSYLILPELDDGLVQDMRESVALILLVATGIRSFPCRSGRRDSRA